MKPQSQLILLFVNKPPAIQKFSALLKYSRWVVAKHIEKQAGGNYSRGGR
jgi:hypothetical protein